MAEINRTITRPVDEYLKFVQESFNTSDFDFKRVAEQLDNVAKSFAPEMDKRNKEAQERAARLREQLDKVIILRDFDKYNKFDRLGNFGLDSTGLLETYRVAADIINDIQVARDWLASYKEFSKFYKTVNDPYTLHSELIILGKSILGRAIELTPKKTGYLRSTGVLYDFGTYIVIAFTASYASYVHENLEIAHPHHASNPNCGGRAKFLEIAMQEFFPNRRVWTEIHGYSGVSVKIAINPLYVEYSHYN